MNWIAGAHGPYWTEERIAELKRLWNLGWSASQIAKQLRGTTRNAVIGKIYRLGLQSRSPAVIAEALKLGDRLRNHEPAKGRPKKRKVNVQANLTALNMAMRKPPKPLPPEKPSTVAASPKPWTERRFGECAYPVGGMGADTLSCCNATGGTAYCAAHAKRMYAKPATPAQRKAARLAREAKAKAIRRAA